MEKAAFFYPRLLKQALGSREFAESDKDDARQLVAFVGVVGVAGVPLSLVCGLPAVALRSGRSVKKRFSQSPSLQRRKKEPKADRL